MIPTFGTCYVPTADDKTQYMSVLDFAQGFGAVQLAASVPTEGAPLGAFYHEHELASDELHYYLIYVSDASKNVSVTVAWFDPPSPVYSYNVSSLLSREGFHFLVRGGSHERSGMLSV